MRAIYSIWQKPNPLHPWASKEEMIADYKSGRKIVFAKPEDEALYNSTPINTLVLLDKNIIIFYRNIESAETFNLMKEVFNTIKVESMTPGWEHIQVEQLPADVLANPEVISIIGPKV